MSAYEGGRLLQGAPGSQVKLLVFRGNAAEPHDVVLTRERSSAAEVTSRMANPNTGYVRIVEFSKATPARLQAAIDSLAKSGASRFVMDLRGTASGDLDDGVAAARLFVKSGTLAVKATKTQQEVVAAAGGDGALSVPLALVVGQGTSGAAEVFAAALEGNDRADLIGERTLGRTARQRLVKLPDGSGLLISNLRYLTPKSTQLHERGLQPDVVVDEPEVEFGAAPPPGDKALDAAVAHLAKAAA
jgi:carboxyl-terminal processing protease